MMTTISEIQWNATILLYNDVLSSLVPFFHENALKFIPYNASYFCLNKLCDTLPPIHPFNLCFLIHTDDYQKLPHLFNKNNPHLIINDKNSTIVDYRVSRKIKVSVSFKSEISLPFHMKSIMSPLLFNRCLHIKNNSEYSLCLEEILCIYIVDIIKHHRFKSHHYLNNLHLFIQKHPQFDDTQFSYYSQIYNIHKILSVFFYKQTFVSKSGKQVPSEHKKSMLLSLYKRLPRLLFTLLGGIFYNGTPLRFLIKSLCLFLNKYIHIICKNVALNTIDFFLHHTIAQAEEKVFKTIVNTQSSFLHHICITGYSKEPFLIGTTSGIWLLSDSSLQQLSIGPTYGITKSNTRWFAIQTLGRFNRLISFSIDSSAQHARMYNIHTELSGLPLAIHQIDSFEHTIYIVNTSYDQLIMYDSIHKQTSALQLVKYPLFSQAKTDQKHFNSIYITHEKLHILAHNGINKKGECSILYSIDKRSFTVLSRVYLNAYSAHNIVFYNDSLFYCNSKYGELKKDETVLFIKSNYFLRGLACTSQYIVLGGSECAQRSFRNYTNAILLYLTHTGTLLHTIELSNIGQIYEIRGFNDDYGLSETSAVH